MTPAAQLPEPTRHKHVSIYCTDSRHPSAVLFACPLYRLLQLGSDLTAKVVLQAFQMGLPCCMERSHLPIMAHQLLLRLMAAATPAQQQQQQSMSSGSDSEACAAAAASTNCSSQQGFDKPALQHDRRLGGVSVGSGDSAAGSVAMQHSAYRAELATWFKRQYQHAQRNAVLLRHVSGGSSSSSRNGSICKAADVDNSSGSSSTGLPPHLLCCTPSLLQAGGVHRMALRGHSGPIRHVLIAPNGKDVLTASDDGAVQVCDEHWGMVGLMLGLRFEGPMDVMLGLVRCLCVCLGWGMGGLDVMLG